MGQPFSELPDRRLRHWRAAIAGDPPGRKIERGEVRLQQAEMVHRRHQAGDGDPLRGHQLEELSRLEGAHQDRAAADVDHRQQRRDQSDDVACRHGEERTILGPRPRQSA